MVKFNKFNASSMNYFNVNNVSAERTEERKSADCLWLHD